MKTPSLSITLLLGLIITFVSPSFGNAAGGECSTCSTSNWQNQIVEAETHTYTVPAQAGASYSWVVSGVLEIVSGQGTNSVTVRGTQAGNGKLCIARVTPGVGACADCLDITVTAADTCDAVSIGIQQLNPGTQCPGDMITVNAIDHNNNITNFQWTVTYTNGVPPIFSGQGTSSIQILTPFNGGVEVKVVGTSDCGASAEDFIPLVTSFFCRTSSSGDIPSYKGLFDTEISDQLTQELKAGNEVKLRLYTFEGNLQASFSGQEIPTVDWSVYKNKLIIAHIEMGGQVHKRRVMFK